MIVLANGKKPTLLDLKRSYLNGLRVRLFSNNVVIDGTTLATDFVESTFPGYSYLPLNFPNPSYLNASDQGQCDGPALTFTRASGSGSEQVYGYFVTDAGGVLVFSETNPAGPTTIATAGQTYVVVPQFLEDSLV